MAEPLARKPDAATVHGTCVALDGRAFWLRGPSGSGKSDLAFRFIQCYSVPLAKQGGTGGRGAVLVADDRLVLTCHGDNVLVSPPPSLEGRLEMRGIGIVEMAFTSKLPLVLIVDLVEAAQVERLPARPLAVEKWHGVDIPLLKLAPFEVTAPDKLYLAMTRLL